MHRACCSCFCLAAKPLLALRNVYYRPAIKFAAGHMINALTILTDVALDIALLRRGAAIVGAI
jgi:hypothetical protein